MTNKIRFLSGDCMSKVWDRINGCMAEMPKEMEDFLNDVESVCKKYGLSISHEDYHGAFLIEEYSKENIEWLFGASKSYKDRE